LVYPRSPPDDGLVVPLVARGSTREPHQFVAPELPRYAVSSGVNRTAFDDKLAGRQLGQRISSVSSLRGFGDRQGQVGIEIGERTVIALGRTKLILHAKAHRHRQLSIHAPRVLSVPRVI